MIVIKLQLLEIFNKPSIEVKRLQILMTKIFKTLNDSNPASIKDIFCCQNKSHKKHNLYAQSRNTLRYGKKQPSSPRCSHLRFFTRKYKIH